MKAINPYLTFPGTAEEAFTFYRTVFGGEFAGVHRYGDMPDGGKLPPAERSKVMHIALPLSNGTVLMASDTSDGCGEGQPALNVGNNFSISIAADGETEVDTLFKALSAGGKAVMAPQKTFWGAYFGMCTDRFGIQWMFNFEYPKS